MLWVAAALFCSCAYGFATQSQTETLSAVTLPQFLMEYEKTLNSVGEVFSDLEKEKLPLLDETGHPLGRRNIQGRSRDLMELRPETERLAAKPDDLVLTMKFLNHTERMADDVYDLSQIAYDNDQEELGKRLTDLLATLDRDQDAIELYALDLAVKKQQRLETLEREKREAPEKTKKNYRGTAAAARARGIVTAKLESR
jgi:hypothetical protein